MRAIDYLQVNMIPVTVLIIMRINAHKTLSYTWRNRALRVIMVLVAAVMLVDTAGWTLNGQPFTEAFAGLWIANTAYFALTAFLAFLWFLYVRDIVENGLGQHGASVLLPSVPLFLFYILLAANPWTHMLFYIDENHYYVRGRFFVICILISLGYMLTAFGMAIYHSQKETNRDVKKRYRLLGWFTLIPIGAGLLQWLNYGAALQWSFTVATLTAAYINVQREQVIRDGLTGLNNRRRLDQYLETLEPWEEREKDWYLLIMDVDRFKKINDTYGHVMGDHVLKLVSEQLKKMFGNTRTFLARYGGDEFVLIMKSSNEKEIEKYVKEIKRAMARIDWGGDDAWKIEVSIGWAGYDKETMRGTADWFALADERMYQQKEHQR